MRQRPIFIIGCERSGTTLLRVMLNAHPRIAIPYEARRFSTLLSVKDLWSHQWTSDQVRQTIDECLSHPKLTYWGLTVEAVLPKLRPATVFRFADIIDAIYRAWASKEGKPRWGDKTPTNTFELPSLAREFPDAQFIHIIRDGRDVYLSWSKVDWGHYAVEKAANKWTKWVQAAADQGRPLGPDRYLEVRYEHLVRRPAETLNTICAFLREPFEASMLSYHANGKSYVPEADKQIHRLLANPPDSSRASVWRREMIRREVSVFERRAGTVLMRFGYPISHGSRARILMGTVARRMARLVCQS